ncbi:hypothetical protein H1R20_g5453, partial [Candolleomyces eurysporus]
MAKKTPKAASSSSGVKPSSLSDDTPHKPLIEISEEEQRRLIEQSGVMKKFKEATEGENSALVTEYIEERMALPDELFNASLFIIPFSFLLLMMEMYEALFLLVMKGVLTFDQFNTPAIPTETNYERINRKNGLWCTQ